MDRRDFAELVEATQAAHPVWFDLPADRKADAEALDEVERQLGVRLAADFGWFLSEYGGGDFAFVLVYSADKASDLYVVRNQPTHANAPVVAFSDDGTGNQFVFPVQDGLADDVVLSLDHETGELARVAYDGFLGFVARRGLRLDAE
jgi:hypothetical protein